MGHLAKIRFPCHTVTVRPAWVRTSAVQRQAVRPVSTPYVRCMRSWGEPHCPPILRHLGLLGTT
jgi:hypothetical protein